MATPAATASGEEIQRKDGVKVSKKSESYSHKWVAYVRGPRGEDMSYCVEKVIFHLHSSFDEPVREVSEFPFELKETGWGEFDLVFRVLFRSPGIPPVDIMHRLKLYPPEGTSSTKKPVVAEVYDEVVIDSPPLDFYELVQSHTPAIPANPLAKFYNTYSEEEDLRKIMAAQNYVTEELQRLTAELHELEGRNQDDNPAFAPHVTRHPTRQ